MAPPADRILSPVEWEPLALAHRRRVLPWVRPRLDRRAHGRKHPIDDFLFDYYRFPPSRLMEWHPGPGVAVAGSPDLTGHPAYRPACDQGDGSEPSWVVAGPGPGQRRRIERGVTILSGIAARPARFGCFGMHEWAMLDGLPADQARHAQVPLRVSPGAISSTVDGVGLRCTHFDAYRFFTPTAGDKQQPLTRAGQPFSEQGGCIHAGMDLYRYAYEAWPFIGSGIVADCFEHARRAREVDMRATPYDFTAYGLAPIPVETAEGRREYATAQRSLAAAAQALRPRVIDALERVLREPATTDSVARSVTGR